MARTTLRQAAGDYTTATALARQTLELDPSFTDAFDRLIRQYKKEANFPAAFDLCDSILATADRLDPDNEESRTTES